MSKNKDQGTRFETYLVNYFTDAGFDARRLAEGGVNDPGDIEVTDAYGDTWVIEAKHRQSLSIHKEYMKILRKAKDRGYVMAGLVWKRTLPKKEGQERRTPAGPPLVVLDLATFTSLLADYDAGAE